MPAPLASTAGILGAAVAIWTGLVDHVVKKPYLDEFFHVPQAQLYCLGHFDRWDPKITTPPGLYLIASSLKNVVGCDLTVLRRENAVCLLALFFIIFFLLSAHDRAHRALNVALFPPLFFFGGLYYTDVASTLSVSAFYLCHSSQALSRLPLSLQAVCLYLLGVTTLFFRQTNIFWVAIYPSALTTIKALDTGHAVIKESMHKKASGFGDSWTSVVKAAWKHKVVYDPDVCEATFEDYLKCILTIVAGLIRVGTDFAALYTLILRLAPFLGLLASFVAFVVWNGSVVLGDKSNHVATLHFPQMLYIWPYILFFSWPTLLLPLLRLAVAVARVIPIVRNLKIVQQHSQHAKAPGVRYIVLSSALAHLAIRYNTIVHPFTLADNRHYTFYVFRLLMRPWWIRYAAIPVYVLGAWICIQASGAQHNPSTASQQAHAGARTSLSMVWIASSALQLVTAPLVEPRYFILPWLFWAVNLPASPRTKAFDKLHWLQTIWMLLVNVLAGYMFLARPFKWQSEPGAVQRFMW